MRIEILTFAGSLSVIDPQSDSAEALILSRCLQRYADQLGLLTSASSHSYAELGYLHYEIGKLHDRLTRYSYARAHYNAAIRAFKQANEVTPSVVQTYLLLGEVECKVMPGLSEQPLFDTAFNLAEDLHDLWLQARAVYNQAQLSAMNNQFQSSLTDYQKAEELIRTVSFDAAPACLPDARLLAEIERSIELVQVEIASERAEKLAEKLLSVPPPIDPGFRSSSNSDPWWAWWRK